MPDIANRSGKSTPGGPQEPGLVVSLRHKPEARPLPQAGGVLLMGGDCSALGVARNLVPRGVPVKFLPGMNKLATLSRYVRNVPGWPGPAIAGRSRMA